jgi:hypothetical protein
MSKMSETPRERFDRLIREGPPQPQPRPKPEPPVAEVIPFNPWGPRRPWQALPPAASNAMPYQPTDIDRLVELQRANAQAAIEDRLRRDPFGTGIWGHESLEDLVRRQNGE